MTLHSVVVDVDGCEQRVQGHIPVGQETETERDNGGRK